MTQTLKVENSGFKFLQYTRHHGHVSQVYSTLLMIKWDFPSVYLLPSVLGIGLVGFILEVYARCDTKEAALDLESEHQVLQLKGTFTSL